MCILHIRVCIRLTFIYISYVTYTLHVKCMYNTNKRYMKLPCDFRHRRRYSPRGSSDQTWRLAVLKCRKIWSAEVFWSTKRYKEKTNPACQLWLRKTLFFLVGPVDFERYIPAMTKNSFASDAEKNSELRGHFCFLNFDRKF